MLRAILIGLAGQGCFIVSVLLMIPLRMKPVANYNLFYVPLMAALFGFLFYRLCTEEKESKAYLYGYFAALLGWPLLGESPAIPVPEGIITQFSSVDLKTLGGYYYVIAGWVILKVLWRTKALKNSACVFFMTFLCIWTFELYMENYSSRVPLEMMPFIGNTVAVVAALVSALLIYLAKKARTLEKQTVMGCLLYITMALVIMGAGQWGKPQSFYIKYEGPHMELELKELQEEIKQFKNLKQEMIKRGWYKEETKDDAAAEKAE